MFLALLRAHFNPRYAGAMPANVYSIVILANSNGNLYLPIVHLPRVELNCKLREKLHHGTSL